MDGKQTSLEDAIKLIDEKIKSYSGATWGMHWHGEPADSQTKESDKYYIKTTIWQEDSWSEDGGGIAWDKYITVGFYDKETGIVYSKTKLGEIRIRDSQSERKDIKSLWGYNKVKIVSLEDSILTVKWDGKDDKNAGPQYTFDLKTGKYDVTK